MPSNEQLVRVELTKEQADLLDFLDTHPVADGFLQGFSVGRKSGVSFQTKQEHKHDEDECAECMKLAVRQYETGHKDGLEIGKASLKPFEVSEEVFRIFYNAINATPLPADMGYAPQDLARPAYLNGLKAIADHFAAPERKPFAISSGVAGHIWRAVENYASEDQSQPRTAILARAINEALVLEPVPERTPFHINTDMRTYFREAYNATARRHGDPELNASYVWNAFHDMEKVYSDDMQPAPEPKRITVQELRDALDSFMREDVEKRGGSIANGWNAPVGVWLTTVVDVVNQILALESTPEPKRERIAVTYQQGREIYERICANKFTVENTVEIVEHVLNSEVSATTHSRCPDCEHADGVRPRGERDCEHKHCICIHEFHRGVSA